MFQRSRVLSMSVATVLMCVGGVHAAPVEAVYLNISVAPAPSARSVVPGALAGSADPRFTAFTNMTRSNDGKMWCALVGTNATPLTQDYIYFTGTGLTGVIRAQEGVTQINDSPVEYLNFGTSLTTPPRLNAAGQWAAAFRLGIAGATSAEDRLAIFNGSGFTVVKPGDAVPAQAGQTYNGGFQSASVLDSGQAAFLALTSSNFGASDHAFTNSGNVLRIEIGVTQPTGQLATPAVAWLDVDTSTSVLYQVNADGSRYIAAGELDTNSANDKIVVVDGAVVLQEGFAVGSVPGLLTAVSLVRMEANGDWFVRGTSTTTDASPVSTVWWVRNGTVIAEQRQPITPGSTELWGSVIREVKGDNSGNYVISGQTSNADTLLNDVLVYNGSKVLARKSDPVNVDINGDNVPETFYLHTLQDRCVLLNDDFYYMTNQLKATATGTTAINSNHSLFRVRVCRADFNANGEVTIDDLFLFINAYFMSAQRADIDGLNGVEIDDLFRYINLYFAGC